MKRLVRKRTMRAADKRTDRQTDRQVRSIIRQNLSMSLSSRQVHLPDFPTPSLPSTVILISFMLAEETVN